MLLDNPFERPNIVAHTSRFQVNNQIGVPVNRIQQAHKKFLGHPYSRCTENVLNSTKEWPYTRQSCREECYAMNVTKTCNCPWGQSCVPGCLSAEVVSWGRRAPALPEAGTIESPESTESYMNILKFRESVVFLKDYWHTLSPRISWR